MFVQLHIICLLSCQNWLSNKKGIKKKNIPQSTAKFVCSVPKQTRGMATMTLQYWCDIKPNLEKRIYG